MTRVERTDERWFEAELHRLRGEALLSATSTNAAKAEDSFRHALSVARKQGAAFWELRASLSLARLLRSQGQWSQSCELLASICARFDSAGFSEKDAAAGYEAPEFVTARALLNDLGTNSRGG